MASLRERAHPFRAGAVAIVEGDEFDFRAVVLAEEPDGGGGTIEFQRSFEFDEQDRELGMDTHCVIVDGRSDCGGLERWELKLSELRLEFTATAARELGIERQVEIVLPDERPSPRALAKALEAVVGLPPG